jgi:broad specificity phosphatase PhoE
MILYAAKNEMFVIPFPAIKRLIDDRARYKRKTMSTSVSNVVLIRPCCTDFDEQNRVQGRLNLPLNPRGEAQLQQLAEQLQDKPMEVIYTSSCEPARSTAAALGEALGLTVKEMDDFDNLDQGLWQGLQVEDLRRKYGKVFRQWQESPETICPPQGETVDELMDRIRKAFEKPLKRGIPFAVVAPEPLAEFIASFLTGRKVDLTNTLCCEQRVLPRWELLTVADLGITPSGIFKAISG